ncbi:MAG: hypothetical protein ACLGHN_15010 [Bacteriovoracia bacterium]
MIKISLLLLIACFVGSCGKAPSMKPYQSSSAYPLTGKSNQEIFKLKYDNRLYLNCRIRVSNGQKVRITNGFADEFTWNILGELSLLRVLNYLMDDEMVIVVRMAEIIKVEDQLSHRGEDGREYYMEHSPVLKILYRRASKNILSNGSVHDLTTYQEATLYENVETRLFEMTTEKEDGSLVTEDLNCMLKTKANPEYGFQWKVVK